MTQGKIRVQTENIFPIIKKFLYNEHDIFIRELVSNAIDATQKLKTLASIGEVKGEIGDLKVSVSVDAEAKTITIADNGVGMTAEEVDKYINQVAFSGAEEFLEKYKGQNEANIIGHFGLGFYSAFMVSKQVEIFTKSFKDAPAMHWTCDGSPEYTLTETEKADRGTTIVLHLNEESLEFADEIRVKSTIQKFGKFLSVPVMMGEEQLNNTNPIWTRKPSELTDEDYINFYKELYPFSETPLFWIHLNVDFPFNLTGVLYFPTIKNSYEVQKDKIQLYCNQVYVTDEVKDIVPEFLMLLHGVIDSPDIPLNVSRSYLQGDPNVRKINSHITKKVADKLEEIYKNDRENYEKKWESLGLFVKYGMMTDDKFAERGAKFLLMQDAVDNKMYAWADLKTQLETTQKNKEGKIVVIYTSDAVGQNSYIQQAAAKGYTIVKLDGIVDNGFTNSMETKWSDVQFVRVDSDVADNLVDKQEDNTSVLSEEETTKLKDLFALQYAGMNLQVDVKGLSAEAPPVIASQPEFMRRMKDMAAMGGGGGMGAFYANMPTEIALTLNGNHPMYPSIIAEANADVQKEKVQQLADLAMLSLGMLKGEELTKFIQRSFGMVKN
ncbi:MAG: molecular chaperone HtpG [Chitinophagaceae bacterium]|nr:molecular chaperone HtpG [Chitinophagaceae bacterium]